MYDGFVKSLEKLLSEHDIHLQGDMRIHAGKAPDIAGASISVVGTKEYAGGVVDITGPFLCATIERRRAEVKPAKKTRAFMVSSDYEGYQCPVSGSWIEGRAAHRENMKKHDVHVLEKGEREHNERNRKEAAEAAIVREAHQMVDEAARRVFN